MKKKKNIILCIALASAMVLASGCGASGDVTGIKEAPAAEPAAEAGKIEFEYTSNKDGTVTLTKYLGREESPVIPESVDGAKVTAIGESAFAANRGIKSIKIPEGISRIGDYAFECCTQLTKAEFPASLESIGKGAFSGCSSLKAANIPEGVTAIGDGAFFFCKQLTEASLPSTLTAVGKYMFSECYELASISLGKGIPEISERMFWSCKVLKEVTIPESVTQIGQLSFARCELMEKCEVPDSVESIGKYAFSGCTVLKAINFPALEVKEGTFKDCLALSEIKMNPKVTAIEDKAFYRTALKSFAIPATLKSLGDQVFTMGKTEEFLLEGENPSYEVEDGVVFSKDMKTLICCPPAKKADSYVIPSSVETIASHAFSGVTDLKGLTISENVKTLEPYAFYMAYSVEEFIVPETVTSIGEGAFKDTQPKKVEVKAQLKELPASAFEHCSAETIIFPDSIEVFGEKLFFQCQNLKELKFPASLSSIKPFAFLEMSGNIISDSSNFKIEDGAVYSADGKTLVWYPGFNGIPENQENVYHVPDTVENIADYAINCYNMTELYLPDGLKSVGADCSFGFSIRSLASDTETKLETKLIVYGPDNKEIIDYAKKTEVAYFTGKPEMSMTSVSLKGDETAQVTLLNAPTDCVSYSCFDENIATVDEKGVITAHQKGKTTVYANNGAAYYKCEVEVTSDGTPVEGLFDTSGYLMLGKDEVQGWMDSYVAANGPDIVKEGINNPYSEAYKGQQYYSAFWSAQEEGDGNSNSQAVEQFDIDYKGQFQILIHGLNTELSCYTQTDDMVLYSGLDGFERFCGCNTVKELQKCVGNVIEEPRFFSTAINETAAQHFSDGLGCMFIVYADSENVNGGYIEYTVGQGAGGEYEILLMGGAKMEIIGAGVREIIVYDDFVGKEVAKPERYVKVHLIG